MKQYEEIINKVINEFNWISVHNYMKSTNWVYASTGKVPTIPELIDTARYLLTRVCTTDAAYWSTGGFKASIMRDKKNNPIQLSLDFIIEEAYWENEE